LTQYGLKTIAVKQLGSLANTVKIVGEKGPYSQILAQMIGTSENPLSPDQVSLLCSSELFFSDISD
jgi:hypothetical protein